MSLRIHLYFVLSDISIQILRLPNPMIELMSMKCRNRPSLRYVWLSASPDRLTKMTRLKFFFQCRAVFFLFIPLIPRKEMLLKIFSPTDPIILPRVKRGQTNITFKIAFLLFEVKKSFNYKNSSFVDAMLTTFHSKDGIHV